MITNNMSIVCEDKQSFAIIFPIVSNICYANASRCVQVKETEMAIFFTERDGVIDFSILATLAAKLDEALSDSTISFSGLKVDFSFIFANGIFYWT